MAMHRRRTASPAVADPELLPAQIAWRADLPQRAADEAGGRSRLQDGGALPHPPDRTDVLLALAVSGSMVGHPPALYNVTAAAKYFPFRSR
jgi:hypothetical protein